jgi:ketosteroid isomerase-like protein
MTSSFSALTSVAFAIVAFVFATFNCPALLHAQQSPCTRAAVLHSDSVWQHSFESQKADEVIKSYDPQAVTAGSAMPPAKGALKLRDMWVGLLADTSFRLTWDVHKAEVLEGCEIAYSTGRWKIHSAQGDTTGTYMAVWRKRPSGTWRVLIDSAWY